MLMSLHQLNAAANQNWGLNEKRKPEVHGIVTKDRATEKEFNVLHRKQVLFVAFSLVVLPPLSRLTQQLLGTQRLFKNDCIISAH